MLLSSWPPAIIEADGEGVNVGQSTLEQTQTFKASQKHRAGKSTSSNKRRAHHVSSQDECTVIAYQSESQREYPLIRTWCAPRA